MTRLVLPLIAALAFGSGSALAQQAPAAQDNLTNCHTAGSTDKSGVKENETTGATTGNSQAVEKSAILPDAGGEGSSAAPTVQRDGKSVEARTDCPDDPKMTKPKGG